VPLEQLESQAQLELTPQFLDLLAQQVPQALQALKVFRALLAPREQLELTPQFLDLLEQLEQLDL
jgi:hypothetical protein